MHNSPLIESAETRAIRELYNRVEDLPNDIYCTRLVENLNTIMIIDKYLPMILTITCEDATPNATNIDNAEYFKFTEEYFKTNLYSALRFEYETYMKKEHVLVEDIDHKFTIMPSLFSSSASISLVVEGILKFLQNALREYMFVLPENTEEELALPLDEKAFVTFSKCANHITRYITPVYHISKEHNTLSLAFEEENLVLTIYMLSCGKNCIDSQCSGTDEAIRSNFDTDLVTSIFTTHLKSKMSQMHKPAFITTCISENSAPSTVVLKIQQTLVALFDGSAEMISIASTANSTIN